MPPVSRHRWRPWWKEIGLPSGPRRAHGITPVPVAALSPQHQEQHSEGRSAPSSEPTRIFVYEDRQILEDAAAHQLLRKRQPAIQKEDQGTIHQLVHQFGAQPLSSPSSWTWAHPRTLPTQGRASPRGRLQTLRRPEEASARAAEQPPRGEGGQGRCAPGPEPQPPQHKPLDDVYSLFFANNNWYFFLRPSIRPCAPGC